jgi:hypothetical protein
MTLVVGYIGYRIGKIDSDKKHAELMQLEREKFEEQKRQWEIEQRDKNSPGLVDWNIEP